MMPTTMPSKRQRMYHVHGPTLEMIMHTFDSGLGKNWPDSIVILTVDGALASIKGEILLEIKVQVMQQTEKEMGSTYLAKFYQLTSGWIGFSLLLSDWPAGACHGQAATYRSNKRVWVRHHCRGREVFGVNRFGATSLPHKETLEADSQVSGPFGQSPIGEAVAEQVRPTERNHIKTVMIVTTEDSSCGLSVNAA
ncbi:unnamed protein product [Protopolystoma xenopodis]|uniref:Uncharacterized protein n=1 Tax=Protopolystoma xenopodis TaxID=117903 RepID=A0A448WIR4_9PLAT|nr:unnamed protein product [Protopolystoma xenopodis]